MPDSSRRLPYSYCCRTVITSSPLFEQQELDLLLQPGVALRACDSHHVSPDLPEVGEGVFRLRLLMHYRARLRELVHRGLNRKRDGADISVYRATHQLWAILQFAAWADEFKVTR